MDTQLAGVPGRAGAIAPYIGEYNDIALAPMFEVLRITRVPMLTLDAGDLALTTARRGLIPN